MKYTNKILILLIVVIGYKGSAYFVNQADYAEVYTNDCFSQVNKEFCVYKGKLKRDFITNDYIIETDNEVITINKKSVVGVATYEKN